MLTIVLHYLRLLRVSPFANLIFGSIEFRMGDVARSKRLARAHGLEPQPIGHAGGDRSRGCLALVKPGLPATAFGGKGLTKANTRASVPPCVRR